MTEPTAPETDATEATADSVTETAMEAEADHGMTEIESPAEPALAARAHSGKKPSKFLADLTKAMQTAAEDARGLALSQLQADAKNHIEQIHGRSSTEAADLRRVADDDVAAIRDWSKAEIARIREETEGKISERKARLERQVEQHAAVIEREIEAVQGTVAGFEADMAQFFERLLSEEDPTQFATMAERLPEPPSFESILGTIAEPEVEEEAVAETATETVDEVATGDAETETETTEVEATEAQTETDPESETVGEAEVQLIGDTPTGDELIGEQGSYEGAEGGDGEVDREAAFAAIQAAAEAAASAEVAADAASRAEAVADVAIEIMGQHGEDGETTETEEDADPRVAALGLSPDYDAAEAEALATADASDGEEIPEINDDALAARLAGLVPNRGSKAASSGSAAATQVIVVGLVSVASIASFKRHLGRVAGVQSVGVSSGPDGEFVFAVNHSADVVLREAIPSLPSFQARVTSSADGVVHVTAHDPESDN
ncbi:MAG TPA: hypothetical protein VFY18_11565 [Candidatus Limnocylindrales bacterium]|nr:hypothetical protein [Candidatus Limnocylindrales bacterium]